MMNTSGHQKPPSQPVEPVKSATADKNPAAPAPKRPPVEVSADKQIAIANIDNPHGEVKID